jgi:hypothetical protein
MSVVEYPVHIFLMLSHPTGAKVAVVELPFDFKSSETKGGVGGT